MVIEVPVSEDSATALLVQPQEQVDQEPELDKVGEKPEDVKSSDQEIDSSLSMETKQTSMPTIEETTEPQEIKTEEVVLKEPEQEVVKVSKEEEKVKDETEGTRAIDVVESTIESAPKTEEALEVSPEKVVKENLEANPVEEPEKEAVKDNEEETEATRAVDVAQSTVDKDSEAGESKEGLDQKIESSETVAAIEKLVVETEKNEENDTKQEVKTEETKLQESTQNQQVAHESSAHEQTAQAQEIKTEEVNPSEEEEKLKNETEGTRVVDVVESTVESAPKVEENLKANSVEVPEEEEVNNKEEETEATRAVDVGQSTVEETPKPEEANPVKDSEAGECKEGLDQKIESSKTIAAIEKLVETEKNDENGTETKLQESTQNQQVAYESSAPPIEVVKSRDFEEKKEDGKPEVEKNGHKEEEVTKETEVKAEEKPREEVATKKPSFKQANNILSKLKQSLIKAKKVIIWKSPSSKTISTNAA